MKCKSMRMGIGVIMALLLGSTMAGMKPACAAEAQVLLEQMDRKRTLPDMSFNLHITSYEGEQTKQSFALWGWVKSGSEQNQALLFFSEPETVKGRKMLMEGNYVYLLFPKTRNPIRLSPLQVLLGETSNGDVVRTGFAKDYDVTAMEAAEWQEKPCHKFSLSAKEAKKNANYPNITLWVEKSSLHPLYAEFFNTNGTLSKKAIYMKYALVGENEMPFLIDVIDGQNPAKHTLMVYLNISRSALPDAVFRREYLEHWTPVFPR